MKKQKIMIVLIATIILFLTIVPSVRALDLNIIDEPFDNIETNNTNNTNVETNNEVVNNEPEENNQVNNSESNTSSNDETLPQTGVAEDTTLFIFIVVCIASAIYAYTKIREYKSL